MPKLDQKRSMRRLYFPPTAEPVLVDVPEMPFLMVDGHGGPFGIPSFVHAVEALFSVSYALKYLIKRVDPEDDYTVMPLEAIWWAGRGDEFWLEDPARWRWTAMVAQPPVATAELVGKAMSEAAAKRSLPALKKVRLEAFREGLSAEVLHIGPYEDQLPTIEKLRAWIDEHDYPLRGRHHEIYLSDPRRCAASRLKTVARQPVGM